MRRSLLAAAAALVLWAGAARAADPFPVVRQGAISEGASHKIVDGGCSAPCTGPQFHTFSSDTPALMTECDGTGRVTVICQPPGFDEPVTVADSGALTDTNSVQPFIVACPWARPRITACTSGTCVCRAWVLQLHGDF